MKKLKKVVNLVYENVVKEDDSLKYSFDVVIDCSGNSITVSGDSVDIVKSITKMVTGGIDQVRLEKMYMIRQVVGEIYMEIDKNASKEI